MTEQELTEDERELVRLVVQYGEALWIAHTKPSTDAESAILAHYRKAKAEAKGEAVAVIDAEIVELNKALGPRPFYGAWHTAIHQTERIRRLVAGVEKSHFVTEEKKEE